MALITNDSFLTISSGIYSAEVKIKGSRFIAHAVFTPDRDQAENEYQRFKKKFYDATHNCFAYRIAGDVFRYSDDGEPSGTAGRPIFQVIEGRNLFQVLLVVTRYFGGTKLGTGGLIRAYSQAANTVLAEVRIVKKIIFSEFEIQTAYEHLREVKDIISRHDGKIDHIDFTDMVVVYCRVPAGKTEFFRSDMIYQVKIREM